MPGATGTWGGSVDTPTSGTSIISDWYNTIKSYGQKLIQADVKILDKAATYLPAQSVGPVVATYQATKQAAAVQRAADQAASFTNGIGLTNFSSSWLDSVFQVPEYAISGNPLTDSSSKTPDGSPPKPAITPPPVSFPFWIKATIAASVLIGTALIVKGSFSK